MPHNRVSESLAGSRLDKWLAAELGCTRSQAQRLIESGAVAIERQPEVKSGSVLKVGMEVTWSLPEVEDTRHETGRALEILYEDESILVIDKSPGIAVHPARGTRGFTVVDGIKTHLGKSTWDYRAGLVHRLDKDTSGVLIIAKNPVILAALQQQWQEHTVKKLYRALLCGILKPEQGTIEAPIERHPRDRKKMHVSTEGRESITHYTVDHYYARFTAAQLQPVTGRTHQIRVHCAAIGYPVAGDHTYGNDACNAELYKKGLTRQFLHCSKITLVHPVTKKEMTFTAPLPEDLERVLRVLE